MRKTLRRHRGDPHGARRRWGIENQDHPPSRETITQESGLRENRTSRLSERTEEGRQPDLLRLYEGHVGSHALHQGIVYMRAVLLAWSVSADQERGQGFRT